MVIHLGILERFPIVAAGPVLLKPLARGRDVSRAGELAILRRRLGQVANEAVPVLLLDEPGAEGNCKCVEPVRVVHHENALSQIIVTYAEHVPSLF